MIVGYTDYSSSWSLNDIYTTNTTEEDFKFEENVSSSEQSALESDKMFYSQVSGNTNVEAIIFTRWKWDPIDAILVFKDGTIADYEYKKLNVSSQEDRYTRTQLYEGIKKDGHKDFSVKWNSTSVYVRYFTTDRQKIAFNLNKIDWSKQDHKTIKASESQLHRDIKEDKEIWFLNNTDAIGGGFQSYE